LSKAKPNGKRSENSGEKFRKKFCHRRALTFLLKDYLHMNLSQNYINAGALKYDEEKRAALSRYTAAVERSAFLKREEKDHWELLGALLTYDQLQLAEKLIISEDLRRLKMKQDLEKIKPQQEA
jgi:hypothetical protein